MIYFIGAGPGAPDLITVRGMHLLEQADMVIYAGSLVNPGLLQYCRQDCSILNSAVMTLEEILAAMTAAEPQKTIIRLHSGDPSLYGAIREQMHELDKLALPYEIVPGVSSMNAAAAVLHAELTPASVSQTVIISREAGRTAVPETEALPSLSMHRASMVLFLSSGMIRKVCRDLISGGYAPETPAAVVYKVSWPDQEIIRGTLQDLPGRAAHIHKTALILVGDFLSERFERSKLYDPAFTHEFRKAGI